MKRILQMSMKNWTNIAKDSFGRGLVGEKSALFGLKVQISIKKSAG